MGWFFGTIYSSMGNQWVFYFRIKVIVWVWDPDNYDFGGQVYKTGEMMKF